MAMNRDKSPSDELKALVAERERLLAERNAQLDIEMKLVELARHLEKENRVIKPKFDPEWRRQYQDARDKAAFERCVTYT